MATPEGSQFVQNNLKPKVKKIKSGLSGLSSQEGYKKHVPSFYIKDATPTPDPDEGVSVTTSSVSSQCEDIEPFKDQRPVITQVELQPQQDLLTKDFVRQVELKSQVYILNE